MAQRLFGKSVNPQMRETEALEVAPLQGNTYIQPAQYSGVGDNARNLARALSSLAPKLNAYAENKQKIIDNPNSTPNKEYAKRYAAMTNTEIRQLSEADPEFNGVVQQTIAYNAIGQANASPFLDNFTKQINGIPVEGEEQLDFNNPESVDAYIQNYRDTLDERSHAGFMESVMPVADKLIGKWQARENTKAFDTMIATDANASKALLDSLRAASETRVRGDGQPFPTTDAALAAEYYEDLSHKSFAQLPAAEANKITFAIIEGLKDEGNVGLMNALLDAERPVVGGKSLPPLSSIAGYDAKVKQLRVDANIVWNREIAEAHGEETAAYNTSIYAGDSTYPALVRKYETETGVVLTETEKLADQLIWDKAHARKLAAQDTANLKLARAEDRKLKEDAVVRTLLQSIGEGDARAAVRGYSYFSETTGKMVTVSDQQAFNDAFTTVADGISAQEGVSEEDKFADLLRLSVGTGKPIDKISVGLNQVANGDILSDITRADGELSADAQRVADQVEFMRDNFPGQLGAHVSGSELDFWQAYGTFRDLNNSQAESLAKASAVIARASTGQPPIAISPKEIESLLDDEIIQEVAWGFDKSIEDFPNAGELYDAGGVQMKALIASGVDPASAAKLVIKNLQETYEPYNGLLIPANRGEAADRFTTRYLDEWTQQYFATFGEQEGIEEATDIQVVVSAGNIGTWQMMHKGEFIGQPFTTNQMRASTARAIAKENQSIVDSRKPITGNEYTVAPEANPFSTTY